MGFVYKRLLMGAAVLLTIFLIAGINIKAPSPGLILIIAAAAALLFFYLIYERGKASSKEIALTAVLAVAAAAVRLPFVFIPGLQPTTFLVIVSGRALGCRAGFMIGSTAALISNIFLGQGPWTLWQMLSWGLAGVSAGIIDRVTPGMGRVGMTLFSFLWGYLFGWIINLWHWATFVNPLNLKTLLGVFVASFLFDTVHALGNGIFYYLFGDGIYKMLQRCRRRFFVEVLPLSPDSTR
ncbi:MAG: ECF transporter S component [Clostridia bacterium]|nr:ECF transporter S component [Clostridia bacterium]